MNEKIDVRFNPNAEVPDTKTYEPKDIPKSRDERIADGKEKVDALKTKVKEGFSKTWKKLSESFYIGVSRGSELPGQVAERAGQAKEKISDTYTVAKNKATELFTGGREFISQKAAEARTRKRVRQWQREMRAGDRDVSRSEREAERQQYRQAREQYKADNEADKSTIDSNKEAVKKSKQEQKEAAAKLEKAEKERREAEERAKKAAAEADKAKQASDADPSNKKLRLKAAEKYNLSMAANMALESAKLDVDNLKSTIDSTEEKIHNTEVAINEIKEKIRDRATAAKERKTKRREARREYFGDKWESAKEKTARVAGKGADWMKQLGKKISSGVGKVARKVANRLDPVESDSNK